MRHYANERAPTLHVSIFSGEFEPMLSCFIKKIKHFMWNEVMCRLVMVEKPFEAFVVIRYSDADSSAFHNLYTGGSLDRYGSLISSCLE